MFGPGSGIIWRYDLAGSHREPGLVKWQCCTTGAVDNSGFGHHMVSCVTHYYLCGGGKATDSLDE